PCTAAADGVLSVSVARRDLRPLPGVTLQMTGAVNLQGVTDNGGQAAFDLPAAGAVNVTPSRSGFRFEPTQLAIPDPAHPPAASFTAFPTTTDLALSLTSDDTTPLVGGRINGVLTLRNLGTEAATGVSVGIGSLPGLVLERAQATLGALEYHSYGTQWKL